MSEELQTVLQGVIRVVNYVKNSPLRGSLFAKLCNNMEEKHMVHPYYCETCWLSPHRVFELKE
jgi:hypothetical protein